MIEMSGKDSYNRVTTISFDRSAQPTHLSPTHIDTAERIAKEAAQTSFLSNKYH